MSFEDCSRVVGIIDMLYLGSVAGAGAIAWHIWMKVEISIKRLVALFVISAIFAIVVYLWTWTAMESETAKHIAISILCGIGATDLVAAIFGVIRTRLIGAIKLDAKSPDT